MIARLSLSVLVVFGATAACRAQATFELLGTLPGFSRSDGTQISGDGAVIAGVSFNLESAFQTRAFIWRATTGVREIPRLPGTDRNQPVGLSLSGAELIGVCQTRGYYWTAADGVFELIAPGASANAPEALSGDGGTVVGLASGTRYRWTPGGGFQMFPPPPDDRSFGIPRISDDGSMIVGPVAGHSPYRVYVMTPAGLEYLPDLGGPLGSALMWMSSEGVVFGRSHSMSDRMPTVRWQSGTVELLVDENFREYIYFPSADGSVYLTRLGLQWRVHNSTGIHPIPLPAGAAHNWFDAKGISGDGMVIWGTSLRDGGPSEAWVWTQAGGPAWLKDALIAAGADLGGRTPSVKAMSRDGTTFTGSVSQPDGLQSLAFRAVLPR